MKMDAATIKIPDDFFGLPYGDRQLITFVEDSYLDEPPQKLLDPNLVRLLKLAYETMPGTALVSVAVPLARLVAPNFRMQIPLPPGIFDAFDHFLRSKQAKKGPDNLRFIRKSWSSRFTLPPGHPRDRVVFAGHPADPHNYMPVADFHRLTFEHKFSEILSILMHLGASKIQVRHICGWDQDFSAKLSIDVPGVELAQGAGVSQHKRGAILFEAELSGSDTVSMPVNLVWFPHESTWKQVVAGRTHHGLTSFLLNIEYQDDYGINVSLKTLLEKKGLEIGGQFKQHRSTTWEICGTFPLIRRRGRL
jgi:hypothetical protein